MFKGILITQADEKSHASLRDIDDHELMAGDVYIDVAYSTLNYKDALAITGKGPVVRHFPMVPGIDLAGTVTASQHPRYQAGDKVVLNGWGVGESHWGGLAQKAVVNGDWLIPLPKTLSEYQAMAIGTAGYTAALSVMALERHGLMPSDGPVLVTGANGGVGSYAIALLAKRGYSVIASTGRPEEESFLKTLGASEIIPRQALSEPGRPLGKVRWAAAIDSVGSHTLVNACAATQPEGAVASCGLAQGMDFPATVAPFILRGVSLLGINSVTQPYERRIIAWSLLEDTLDNTLLDAISRTLPLEEVISHAHLLLAGKVRGRWVVDVNR